MFGINRADDPRKTRRRKRRFSSCTQYLVVAFSPTLARRRKESLGSKQLSGWKKLKRFRKLVVRAKRAQVPVVLGSATPALESMLNALEQRSQKVELEHRAGAAESSTWAFVPLNPNELTPAIRGPSGHG